MSDTFFTSSPHWGWYITLYFFVGGIAGGAFFLASLLHLFGRPEDRPVVRTGYQVAFVGAVVSGLLLTVDLTRPERFWHMMIRSNTGAPMLKPWSPMSVGVWGLLLFSLAAFLAAAGSLAEEGRWKLPAARRLARGFPGAAIAVGGTLLGFFLAGYTGVLVSVTNRPIWADTTLLGLLFLVSAASTGAAALVLLGRRRGAHAGTLEWLTRFDRAALVFELVVLAAFLVSLGSVARVFLGPWGAVLGVGVAVGGILTPLALEARAHGAGGARGVAAAAWLVLAGGLLLRMVVIFASEGIHVAGSGVVVP